MGGLVTRESGFPLGDKASLSLASVIALNILPLSSIVIAVLASLKGYTFSERPHMSQLPCHRGMANGCNWRYFTDGRPKKALFYTKATESYTLNG